MKTRTVLINRKIPKIINRIYNCKFRSAYEIIKTIRNVPKNLLNTFKKASIELDDCGWGGTLISDRADELARLLGYIYDEGKDYYVKKHKIRKYMG